MSTTSDARAYLHLADGTVVRTEGYRTPRLDVPWDAFPTTRILQFERDESPDADGSYHYRQIGERTPIVSLAEEWCDDVEAIANEQTGGEVKMTTTTGIPMIDPFTPGLADNAWDFLVARLRAEGRIAPALAKAMGDPFDYALGLRNGQVFRFIQASPIDAEWVHLELMDPIPPYVDPVPQYPHNVPSAHDTRPFSFDRGIDVRLSEIVWVSDAPHGS